MDLSHEDIGDSTRGSKAKRRVVALYELFVVVCVNRRHRSPQTRLEWLSYQQQGCAQLPGPYNEIDDCPRADLDVRAQGLFHKLPPMASGIILERITARVRCGPFKSRVPCARKGVLWMWPSSAEPVRGLLRPEDTAADRDPRQRRQTFRGALSLRGPHLDFPGAALQMSNATNVFV